MVTCVYMLCCLLWKPPFTKYVRIRMYHVLLQIVYLHTYIYMYVPTVCTYACKKTIICISLYSPFHPVLQTQGTFFNALNTVLNIDEMTLQNATENQPIGTQLVGPIVSLTQIPCLWHVATNTQALVVEYTLLTLLLKVIVCLALPDFDFELESKAAISVLVYQF